MEPVALYADSKASLRQHPSNIISVYLVSEG